jgi:stage V sporulation protein S
MVDVIKVKANSRTAAVAGAIAGVIREHKHADIQAIGAGAVNQAVKARYWPGISCGGWIVNLLYP